MIIVTPSFSKSSFPKNFFGLKSVFDLLCFHEGLLWTVGLTFPNLVFSIFSGVDVYGVLNITVNTNRLFVFFRCRRVYKWSTQV